VFVYIFFCTSEDRLLWHLTVAIVVNDGTAPKQLRARFSIKPK